MGSRVTARLDLGLFDSILPARSMAAVFEAVRWVIAEDYVDGLGGWTEGPAVAATYANRHAAVSSTNFLETIDGEVMRQADLETANYYTLDLRINTDYFSTRFSEFWADTFSDDYINGNYAWTVTELLDLLDAEVKNLPIGRVPLSSLESPLRTTSANGLSELRLAYNLFNIIVNCHADDSAYNHVLGLISSSGFAGNAMDYNDGVPIYNFQQVQVATIDGQIDIYGSTQTGPFGLNGYAAATSTGTTENNGVSMPSFRGSYNQRTAESQLGQLDPNTGSVEPFGNRFDTTEVMIDPIDGVTKTVGAVMAGADSFTSSAGWTLAELQDPLLTRITDNFPAGLKPGWTQGSSHTLEYEMKFDTTLGDQSDWAYLAASSASARKLAPTNGLVSYVPNTHKSVYPKQLNLPFGFNPVRWDSTLVNDLEPNELGLLPARLLCVDSPETNDYGQTMVRISGVDFSNPVAVRTGRTTPTINMVGFSNPPNLFYSGVTGAYFNTGIGGLSSSYGMSNANANPLKYWDPALQTSTQSFQAGFTLRETDNASGTGAWAADGEYVFDGRTTMDLFNKDKHSGIYVNGMPSGMLQDYVVGVTGKISADYADDSVLVRDYLPYADSAAAAVLATDTFVLSQASGSGLGGPFVTQTGLWAVHEALHDTQDEPSFVEIDAGGDSEMSVHPYAGVDIYYHVYLDGSGDTKYQWPVFPTASAAQLADRKVGGDGASFAYGVTVGAEPVLLATQAAIDTFNGVVVYQSVSRDTDARETFNRDRLRTTNVDFREGGYEGQSDHLLDTFFYGYPDVLAGTGTAVLTDIVDVARSPLTWAELAILLDDPTMGGDVYDPEPGRRYKYLAGSGIYLGVPQVSGEPAGYGGVDEGQREALLPYGARFASKFKPGWLPGTPAEPWTPMELFEQGNARIAAGVSNYSQVPEDNLYGIDYRYLQTFTPRSAVSVQRVF